MQNIHPHENQGERQAGIAPKFSGYNRWRDACFLAVEAGGTPKQSSQTHYLSSFT